MNYLKTALKLSPIIIILIFAVYIIFDLSEEKAKEKARADQLNSKLNYLQSEIKRINDISVQAESEKLKLENDSLELQEKLNEALKNNKCSDELIPSVIANKLYNRANNIRKNSNAGKFIK